MRLFRSLLVLCLVASAHFSQAQELELGRSKLDAMQLFGSRPTRLRTHGEGAEKLYIMEVDSVVLWNIRGNAGLVFNSTDEAIAFAFFSDPLDGGGDSSATSNDRFQAVKTDLESRFGPAVVRKLEDGVKLYWVPKEADDTFWSYAVLKGNKLTYVKDRRKLF